MRLRRAKLALGDGPAESADNGGNGVFNILEDPGDGCRKSCSLNRLAMQTI
jgi:hypothetical protein